MQEEVERALQHHDEDNEGCQKIFMISSISKSVDQRSEAEMSHNIVIHPFTPPSPPETLNPLDPGL